MQNNKDSPPVSCCAERAVGSLTFHVKLRDFPSLSGLPRRSSLTQPRPQRGLPSRRLRVFRRGRDKNSAAKRHVRAKGKGGKHKAVLRASNSGFGAPTRELPCLKTTGLGQIASARRKRFQQSRPKTRVRSSLLLHCTLTSAVQHKTVGQKEGPRTEQSAVKGIACRQSLSVHVWIEVCKHRNATPQLWRRHAG